MNRWGSLFALAAIVVACSNGNTNGDAGTDAAPVVAIGANPAVPQTCQSCLATSSSSDCGNKQKLCAGDPNCVALNTCIDGCASVTANCISNCANSASSDAINEWATWYACTCGDCGTQCAATFCGLSGNDAGSDAGSCAPDNAPCSADGQCCALFCASDGYCGCIPPNGTGCVSNIDCCSNSCDAQTGTCL